MAVMIAVRNEGGRMRPLTTKELTRYDWLQLVTLLRAIEGELPVLPEGSADRRSALINLYTIRRVLANRY
jgi:hypothetical protein